MSAQADFWGRLIRELREKQRVTQRTLASHAKVNRSTLRSIEAGLTSGDVATIERLLDYLGYELEAMERDSQTERLRRQAQYEVDPDKRSALALQRVTLMFTPLIEPA